MHFSIRAVVTVALIVLPGLGFAQVKPDEPVKLSSCANTFRSGRRIVSNLEIVEFYVPRFASVKKCRDVDYVEYYVGYGPKQNKLCLRLMFGPLVGGQSPHDLTNTSIKWTAHKWGCQSDEGGTGTDWRGTGTGDRRWRHIAIPLGFATYENATPKAADYFDKILDNVLRKMPRLPKMTRPWPVAAVFVAMPPAVAIGGLWHRSR
jgi:hypothetical protein